MSGLFSAMDVSASALTAQRRRLELLVTNLANAQTTKTPEGGPYRRKDVVFESQSVEPFWKVLAEAEQEPLEGVRVKEVITDTKPPVLLYQPNHPDADPQGYVAFPNVNPMEEMANVMAARRSYEANVRAFEAIRELVRRSLEIAR
ncbi:MAG: flagellar basal body rod protein FlgC [Acidobacteriota bacterium]|jgi:flagellar basal-body rod protein FlgC